MQSKPIASDNKSLSEFLNGKSELAILLFDHFVTQFKSGGQIQIIPTKTMIGIATSRKRIAYITQLGKNFIHVVFLFEKPYSENLCFHKIAQVPGDAKQFNHHFRMYAAEDVNDEVRNYMKLAYTLGS